MNNIVIMETSLAAGLLQSGILRYFNSKELCFFITDLCFEAKPMSFNNNKAHAQMLVNQGLLKVVSLDSIQMQKVEKLYHQYKPKFVAKTLSAIVFATDNDYILLSEDELLRETANSHFGISSHDKEWLLTTLIYDLSSQGVQLDLSLLKQIIV